MVSRAATELSAMALAAAKREGRFYQGRVYGTRAQAQQARGSVVVSGGARPQRRAGLTAVVSPTAGWKSSVESFSFGTVLANATGFWGVNLIGTSVNHTHLFTGIHGEPSVRIQGIRIEVKIGFAATKLRWASGVATSLSAGGKTPAQVMSLAGAVGSHDPQSIDAWFTVGFPGVVAMTAPGTNPAVTFMVGTAMENAAVADSTERVDFTLKVTVLKPAAAGQLHVL